MNDVLLARAAAGVEGPHPCRQTPVDLASMVRCSRRTPHAPSNAVWVPQVVVVPMSQQLQRSDTWVNVAAPEGSCRHRAARCFRLLGTLNCGAHLQVMASKAAMPAAERPLRRRHGKVPGAYE
jgi:hypothetical protein